MHETVYFYRDLYAPPFISGNKKTSGDAPIECSLVEERGGWGLYEAEGEGYIWMMPHPDPPGGGEYTLMSCWMADDPRQPAAKKPAMTYAEALQAGYRPCGTALQRGYVSRLADPGDAEVHVAGGTRHGQLYVLLNNPRSNQYCIRQYLRRDER